jgi:hypothetical protein
LTTALSGSYTNAYQDGINQRHRVSPFHMMLLINAWSALFAAAYLLAEAALLGPASELQQVRITHLTGATKPREGRLPAFQPSKGKPEVDPSFARV